MKNKINRTKGRGIFVIMVLAIALAIVGVIAQNNPLEDELMQLETELNNAGYSWLVDYSGEIGPKVEVYEYNSSEKIAEFTELKENEYNKIYLDGSSGAGLGERTQNVFDLRITEDSQTKIARVPYEVMQKKIRLDELREVLKNV